MTEWAVTIEGPGELTDDDQGEFAHGVDHLYGAVSTSSGRVSATLTVKAAAPEAAIDTARQSVAQWIPTVDSIEIHTADRHEALLDTPAPELVGVAEIAEMADVTRQRISYLWKAGSLPRPRAQLASGPVWERQNLTRWLAEWARTPGRPSKTNASASVIS